MHPDKRVVIEKALEEGKKLVSRTTQKYYIFKDETGEPIIKTEEELLQEEIEGTISPRDISKSELTLELYIFDNTQEGSSYPVDYSFMGWFDWDLHDISPGIYDYAGIVYDGSLVLYGSGEVAYNEDNESYSGEDYIGTEDVHNSAGYVAYYNNHFSGYDLDHGWVFADARQNIKQNLEGNANLSYFHTYSDAEYSITISVPPSITITPTTSQWKKPVYDIFWY